MKIVIDIDEESYEHIKAYSNEEVLPIGWYAIINGTPLPKGHGRLIDADELFEMTNNYKAELGRLVADPFVKSGIETVEGFVTDILPTIIEADKEVEE